jgi:hypothetical protein
MPVTLFLPLFPLVMVLLYGFVLFDRLLRAEYEGHRQIWEADGRPRGFFWRPAESSSFDILSQVARLRLNFAWLFRTPSWIAESPLYKVSLRKHRLAVLIWNVGVLVWFVFFLRYT